MHKGWTTTPKIFLRRHDMGTRSVTTIRDEEGRVLVSMYRQMDGSLSEHGKELYDWLTPITIVNGVPVDNHNAIANTMTCLAAQLVAHFKDGPGGIYLRPLVGEGTRQRRITLQIDYTYDICPPKMTDFYRGPALDLELRIYNFGEILCTGTVREFPKFKEEEET
jgi:hypothetical protein